MVWRGWKSNKFVLNLEKTKATQVTVKRWEINNREIDNFVEICEELERFFESLFQRKLRKTKHAYNEFLRDISLTTLTQERKKKFLMMKWVNKWFLWWKVVVITNLQEAIVGQKSFMKFLGKNWKNLWCIHEFKSEQKISHIPKVSRFKIIRKEEQR